MLQDDDDEEEEIEDAIKIADAKRKWDKMATPPIAYSCIAK